MKAHASHPIVVAIITLASLMASTSHASVVIHGTRLVYPMDATDVTVRLENKGKTPSLVQVWLDDGDRSATPETSDAPFSLTPPVFRMEPAKQQVVRVRHTEPNHSSKHERMYWLNVLEVPAMRAGTPSQNTMRLSFRTRIRVFLRPGDLPYESGAAPAKLQWRLIENGGQQALEVMNPTPYHLSLSQVALLNDSRRYEKASSADVNAGMLMPAGASKRFSLPSLAARPSGPSEVEFTVVNDFGARKSHKADLLP